MCVCVCVSISQREKWGYNYSTTDKIMTNCSDFPSEPSKFLPPFMSTLPFFSLHGMLYPSGSKNPREGEGGDGVVGEGVMGGSKGDFTYHTVTMLSVFKLESGKFTDWCSQMAARKNLFEFCQLHYPAVMYCGASSFQS